MNKGTTLKTMGMSLAAAAFAISTGCAFPDGNSAAPAVPANGGNKVQSLNSFASLKANIIDAKCTQCHSGSRVKGGVDLSTFASIMAQPGLAVPGQPEASRIFTEVATGSMPDGGPALAAEETKAIRDWILAGAPNGDFASSDQPVAAPTPDPTPDPTPQVPPPDASIPVPPAPMPTPSGPSGPRTPTVGVSYAFIQQNVFNQSCVKCHSSPALKGGVDLSSYAALMANAKKVVDVGNASGSLAYTEMAGGDMPPRGALVDPQLIELFAEWINEGAQNN